MVRVACPNCKYTTDLSKREVEYGIICPECHGRKLKVPRKLRRENAVVSLRPGTVRALVGGVICIVLGPIVLLAGFRNWHGPSSMLGTRMVAWGILLLIAAAISLTVGLIGVLREMSE